MITAKRLIDAARPGVAAAVAYTAPEKTRVLIKRFAACNPTAAAVSLTAYLVPAGGTASSANALISARSIAAGATLNAAELTNQVLEPGGSIYLLATTAAALVVHASGFEIAA